MEKSMIEIFISSLHKVCLEQPDDDIVDSLWFEPTSIELADSVWLATHIGIATEQKKSLILEDEIFSKQSVTDISPLLPENIESTEIYTSNTNIELSPIAFDVNPDSNLSDSLTKKINFSESDSKDSNINKRFKIHPHYSKPTHIIQSDSKSYEKYYKKHTKKSELHSPDINKRKSQQRKGKPFKSPAATILPDPLGIERALRPLMRSKESRKNKILDEEATIQRVVEEGIWCPVLQGEPERWFEITLVIDQSPSMIIWQETIEELKYLFERHVAFRQVRVWSIVTKKDKNKAKLYSGAGQTLNYNRPCSPRELIDPLGRNIIIMITDCVSTSWHNEEMINLLKLWGKTNSVTLLQTLPRRLWNGSALREAKRVQLQASTIGLPNSKMKVFNSAQFNSHNNKNSDLKIPVLTIDPKQFLVWSNVMTGKGNAKVLGVILSIQKTDRDKSLVTTVKSNKLALTAEQRIKNFFSMASPMAQRLVCYLAAAPLTLPVMRLIQRVMLPKSRQVHLAEVFLGGLLKQEKTNQKLEDTIKKPNLIEYDFHDGVRTKLLDLVLIPDALKVVDNVSKFIEHRLGQSLDFQAILLDPTIATDRNIKLNEKSLPFAAIQADILRRLGGEYSQLANRIEKKLINAHRIPLEEVKEGMVLHGVVTAIKNFGAFVDLGGIEGLLHISNMAWHSISHPSDILNIGDLIDVIVLKTDLKKGHINLGLKQLTDYPDGLQEGMIVDGVVNGIQDYGAFIKIGDINAFLPKKEISRRVSHPSEHLKVNQKVQVQIKKIKIKRGIFLSMRQANWKNVSARYVVKSCLIATVVNIVDYGCFVEIEKGVEGLVHISEMSWNKKTTPSQLVQLGDMIKVMILDIDEVRQRISLSMIKCRDDPYITFAETHVIGEKITAKISTIVDYGIFIRLEEGIDGLLHVNNIPSAKVSKNTLKNDYKTGGELEVLILSINPQEHRISLGLQ